MRIVAKRYKCFNSDGIDITLKPVNVLIGKNNTGKTSFFDVIKFIAIKRHKLFDNSSVIVEEDNSEDLFSHSENLPERFFRVDYERIRYEIIKGLDEKDEPQDSSIILRPLKEDLRTIDDELTKLLETKKAELQRPLDGEFYIIGAERNIVPEQLPVDDDKLIILEDGSNLTTYLTHLEHYKENTTSDINLILGYLNLIFEPEEKFSCIKTRFIGDNNWEIYFEIKGDKLIPISKLGSGVKTAFFALTLMYLKACKSKPTVFVFEELENNLHPSALRKLLGIIKNHAQERPNNYYFISSHSNVAIDVFSTEENAQIIHVQKNKKFSQMTPIKSLAETNELILELGYKASDILQTNGIIWVEGPTDRVYINKWLELAGCEHKEGIHFSFMYYGGKVLSNFEFNIENEPDNYIELFKINTNAFIVMDSDLSENQTYEDLRETKKRVETEIGKENCWITQGREIENYISSDIIYEWINELYYEDKDGVEETGTLEFKEFDNIDKFLQDIVDYRGSINWDFKARNRKTIKYSSDKMKHTKELIRYINETNWKEKDIEDRIVKLMHSIKIWNS